MKTQTQSTHTFLDLLWNGFCMATLVGVWPRFIEPNLLLTTRLSLPIDHLNPTLAGTKIVQISDLHLNPYISDNFLKKLARKICHLKPDLILLTGDLICFARPTENKRLEAFLNLLSAPYGCFVSLGNHDYAQYVTVGETGDYVVKKKEEDPFNRVFSRFCHTRALTKRVTEEAKQVPLNAELVALLKRTPFQLLHNETVCISVRGAPLNITGLGEYTLGRTDPTQAFAKFKKGAPGIALLHNPDALPLLQNSPAEIVLCGHTHGGQVNIPWLWKKFTRMENECYKSGLHQLGKKWAYINRGIASTIAFRWFAPPEILSLQLYAHV